MPTLITLGGGGCKGFGLTSVAFPRKPVGLLASSYTVTGFTFSWNDDPIVTSYSTSIGSTPLTGVTITKSGSIWSTVIDTTAYTPNTSFDFFVTATNEFGSTKSNALPVMTNAAPPTGLAVSSITVSSFSLSWTAITGLNYTLWQGTNQITGVTINPAGTSITGLGSNTGYTYYVKAANSTYAYISSAGIGAATLPAAPSVGTITESNLTASVAVNFTTGGGFYTASYYTVTCVELNVTSIGGSPVYFGSGTGFVTGSLYTFTATATTTAGTSAVSSASSQMRARVVLNYSVDSYSNGIITTTTIGYTSQSYAVVNLTLTGNYYGGATNYNPACTVNVTLTNGATLNVINNAFIYGHDGYWSSSRGEEFYTGGDALSIAVPCTFTNNGTICGGGGRSAVTSSTYGYTGGSPGPAGGRALIISSGGVVVNNYSLITGGGGGGGQGGASAYYPGPSGGGSGGNGGDAIVSSSGPSIYNYSGGTISGGGGAGGAGGGGAGSNGNGTASINGYAGQYGNTYQGSQSLGHGGKGGDGAYGSTAGLGAEGGSRGQAGGTAGNGLYSAGGPGAKGAAFNGSISVVYNAGTINY